MGFRQFTDREGRTWEVRTPSKDRWAFEPTGENPAKPRTVRSPGYERDPFELSKEELQRLLDESGEGPRRSAKSPFQD